MDICLILVCSLPAVVFPSSAVPLEIPALPDVADEQKQYERTQYLKIRHDFSNHD